MVFLDSPGPILFRCTRVGLGGEPFDMLKFRKMRRDAVGTALTSSRDERFTPIGRFLALTRLDELPQVWNVIKGDMRLVGPRPETCDFTNSYPEQYAEILTVTPGLTGLAQLRFAGESQLLEGVEDRVTRYREHILPEKINLDLAYVRSHTAMIDIKILVGTLVLPLVVLGTATREALARTPRSALGLVASVLMVAMLLVTAFTAQA
jgi:lipopolysaccharide/colanic/teichoic acid biosynthesis glycosyltransferase